MSKGNEMKKVKKLVATAGALACLALTMVVLTGGSGLAQPGGDATTQIAELYQLQAAFHAAASGAGVSEATKAQHLEDMLALWTEDGTLEAGGVTYTGKGIPGTPSCEVGALTLCDLFANHAGSFQLGRDWVSLAPSFKTSIEVHGNTADLYFECHYFDVPTGAKMADLSFELPGQPGTAQARKVNGQWLLSYAVGGFAPLSSW